MPRSIEQMIAQQVRRWTQEAQPARQHPEPPWPLITISREFGARGAALAGVLGARTGFRVWDRALVHAIAEITGGDEMLMETLDEHRRKVIEDAIGGLLMGGPHSHLPYLRALLRIVRTIAAHGAGIIIGRGANYILKPEEALRVRVVCPLEKRVRGYAQRQGLSFAEARQHVVRTDADRADYVQFHFRRDVENASDYDLVLNAGTYDLDEMAALTLAAYEAKMGRCPEPEPAAVG